jgi:hypothetical protein
MSCHKHLTAGVAYELFHLRDDDWLKFLVKSTQNAHMGKVVLLKDSGFPVSFEEPRQKLVRHAPQSLQISPLTVH